MRYLFLHTNFPAQWRHIAAALALQPENEVVFATTNPRGSIPGVKKVLFKAHREVRKETHHYVRGLEYAVLNGQGVYRALAPLKAQGFQPDVIGAHSGWGTGQFVKDLFPDAGFLGYFEWYYKGRGSDADFIGDRPMSDDDHLRLRSKNAPIVLDLVNCDWGLSPTGFQRSQFPEIFHPKMSVLHDGVDTNFFVPDPNARLKIKDLDLSHVDEIITYVARGMEPYRGFPQFMEALSKLQRMRPNLHAVIIGADRVAYGTKLEDGRTYKQKALDELDLDQDRIHFTGLLPYPDYLRCVQAAKAHVYLTVPFVLSWSMIETMSAGALLVASDTEPVREVIEDGVNGLLVDFFDTDQIAARLNEAVERYDDYASIRAMARETALDRYALNDSLPKLMKLLDCVARRDFPPKLD